MPVLVNAKLRTAAATECSKIDALRSDRKPLCDRLSYLGDEGNEEAKHLKNQICVIDAEILELHAEAKRKANASTAADLNVASTKLTMVMQDSGKIQSDMLKENSRHHKKVLSLLAKQAEHDGKLQSVGDDIDAAAESLLDGGEAGAPSAGVDDAPAQGSSSGASAKSSADAGQPDVDMEAEGEHVPEMPVEDALADAGEVEGVPADPQWHPTACPDCGKVCKGKRGLASHTKHCRGQPGPARLQAPTVGETPAWP